MNSLEFARGPTLIITAYCRRGHLIVKLMLLITICGLAWLGYVYLDAETRIEAGVINEIAITEERDFLIQLPAMMKKAQNRQQLLLLLKEIYPNVLIGDVGQDVCWGSLRLKFVSATELVDITEGCN